MDTLILLPGLHGTADLFASLRAEIPPHIPTRAIAYPTDQCLNYNQLLRRLEHELRDESRMILIAESFSGTLAIPFAVVHPGRVRAVILCASFIRAPVPRILSYLATPVIWLRCPIPGIAIRTFISGFRAPRELVRDARRAIRRNRPRVLAHRVRLTGSINATKALQQCPVPILCLAGRRDRLIGQRSIRRIHRLRPDIAIKHFDAPHLLLQTKPAEVWEAISNFLGDIAAKPGKIPLPAGFL